MSGLFDGMSVKVYRIKPEYAGMKYPELMFVKNNFYIQFRGLFFKLIFDSVFQST